MKVYHASTIPVESPDTKHSRDKLDFGKGMQTKPLYDAVAGGIANDKVFNTIDLFFAGIISKAEALGRLKFEVPNHQLCILNENLIRKHLHFIIKAIKL